MDGPERIDPHVHCRDEAWRHKATVAGTLELARENGVGTVFDMPNVPDEEGTAVVNADRVEDRLSLVPDGAADRYFLYVGLTPDRDQVVHAVECFDRYDRVVGFKEYHGHSTGRLGVINPDQREMIVETLADAGYDGVLTVHCEEPTELHEERWDPERPVTHAAARPPRAEVAAVEEQIELVEQYDPDFSLVIAHTSCPDAVEQVQAARARGLDVYTEVTPHHLLWSKDVMRGRHGLTYKMNPPLRDLDRVRRLRQQLRDGDIDFIGTDHAPHTQEDKQEDHASGYPTLELYDQFVTAFLPELGLDTDAIDALTRENIVDIFGNVVE